MPEGTIKKLVADKGFGFIGGNDGEDIFFHLSAVEEGGFEALYEGQQVEYEDEEGRKGRRATWVKPAG